MRAKKRERTRAWGKEGVRSNGLINKVCPQITYSCELSYAPKINLPSRSLGILEDSV